MQSHEHEARWKRLYNCGRAYCNFCCRVRASRHCHFEHPIELRSHFPQELNRNGSDRQKWIHRVRNECSIWHFYEAGDQFSHGTLHAVVLPSPAILYTDMNATVYGWLVVMAVFSVFFYFLSLDSHWELSDSTVSIRFGHNFPDLYCICRSCRIYRLSHASCMYVQYS